MMVRCRAVVYSVLATTFIVTLILSFSPMGFPYSDSKLAPRPQRFSVFHIRRSFYDHNSAHKFSEVGYLISTYDRNSLRTLEGAFGSRELHKWEDDVMCRTEAYCGFPIFSFDRDKYMRHFYQAPSFIPTRFTLLEAARNPNNSSQLFVDFSLDVTCLTLLYITAGDGWKYVGGSLPSTERSWQGKPFRYSKITIGKKDDIVMREFIALEVNRKRYLLPKWQTLSLSCSRTLLKLIV